MASGIKKSMMWSPNDCCLDRPCNSCIIKMIDNDDDDDDDDDDYNDGYNLRSQTTTEPKCVKSMYDWVKENCCVDTQTICLERILMAASFKDKPNIVKYIIREEGAPVDFIPEKYRYDSRLDRAWAEEHEAFLDDLIGPDSNEHIMTPVKHAIYHNNIELLIWLIDEAGADLDFETPLGFAVDNNKPAILSLLLEKGADPNKSIYHTIQFCEGSALHLAIKKESIEMVQILLHCERTDVNIMNDYDEHNESGEIIPHSPIMDACHTRNQSDVKLDLVQLLLHHGADVNALSGPFIDEGPQTALSVALDERDIPCMKLLIKHGADPTIVIPEASGTFLERAAESNNIDVLKFALEVPIDITAKEREQVLINAAGTGNVDILKLAMTPQDRTNPNIMHVTNALLKATSYETMKELLKLGANPNKTLYGNAEEYEITKAYIAAHPNLLIFNELTYDTNTLFTVFRGCFGDDDELKSLELLIQYGAIPSLFLDRLLQDVKYRRDWIIYPISDERFHEMDRTVKDPALYGYLGMCMSQSDIPRFKALVALYVKGLPNEEEILAICNNMPDVCSLQHQCRSYLRENIRRVSCNLEQCLMKLRLPKPLRDYVMFKV